MSSRMHTYSETNQPVTVQMSQVTGKSAGPAMNATGRHLS